MFNFFIRKQAVVAESSELEHSTDIAQLAGASKVIAGDQYSPNFQLAAIRDVSSGKVLHFYPSSYSTWRDALQDMGFDVRGITGMAAVDRYTHELMDLDYPPASGDRLLWEKVAFLPDRTQSQPQHVAVELKVRLSGSLQFLMGDRPVSHKGLGAIKIADHYYHFRPGSELSWREVLRHLGIDLSENEHMMLVDLQSHEEIDLDWFPSGGERVEVMAA